MRRVDSHSAVNISRSIISFREETLRNFSFYGSFRTDHLPMALALLFRHPFPLFSQTSVFLSPLPISRKGNGSKKQQAKQTVTSLTEKIVTGVDFFVGLATCYLTKHWHFRSVFPPYRYLSTSLKYAKHSFPIFGSRFLGHSIQYQSQYRV